MSLIAVDPTVFERLKRAYRDQYASPDKLIAALDEKFEHQPGKETSKNLISEKTIRSFFSAVNPPKARLQNLNYFCNLLLGMSYDSALDQLSKHFGQPDSSALEQASEAIDTNWEGAYAERLRKNQGSMKILDMTQPLELDKIYTEVIVSDTIRSRQYRTTQDLMSQMEAELATEDKLGYARITSQTRAKRIRGFDAVKAHRKLMVYGKPGAGKSIFAKALALFFPTQHPDEKLVSIYISLKEFSESGGNFELIDAVVQGFSPVLKHPQETVQNLLASERCFVLLDGLDEVVNSDMHRICRCIDNFVRRYPQNRFVITCRTAACDYTFTDFTGVEIADFDKKQVATFSRKWFEDRQAPEGISDKFLQLLSADSAYSELTTSPLLLTMLCWVFEDRYELSKNRHVLFGDVVDVLLRRWDASRRIERNNVPFDKLSRQRKVDLFSAIAYAGFKQIPQKHFWQEEDLEEIIQQFIQHLSEVQPDTVDEDTKELLRAIQANTGILIEHAKKVYGFSHLTFQEYFAARYILYSGEPDLIEQTMTKPLCTGSA